MFLAYIRNHMGGCVFVERWQEHWVVSGCLANWYKNCNSLFFIHFLLFLTLCYLSISLLFLSLFIPLLSTSYYFLIFLKALFSQFLPQVSTPSLDRFFNLSVFSHSPFIIPSFVFSLFPFLIFLSPSLSNPQCLCWWECTQYLYLPNNKYCLNKPHSCS